MSDFFKLVAVHFTPAKCALVDPVTPDMLVTRTAPSVFVSKAGHMIMALIYTGFIAWYSTFLLTAWAARPPSIAYGDVAASTFGPIQNLKISVSCTSLGGCGDFRVLVNFTSGPCASLSPSTGGGLAAFVAAGTQPSASVTLPLCVVEAVPFSTFASGLFQIPGVQVDFSNVSATATGIVAVSGPDGEPLRSVSLDSVQVKELVIGQNVEQTASGVVTSRTYFPVATQYAGKRSTPRATLIISVAPLVGAITTTPVQPATIIGVLASCAMSAWVAYIGFIVIVPVFELVFPNPSLLKPFQPSSASLQSL